MSKTIGRSELLEILNSWRDGKLTSGQVHDWANDRFAVSAWEVEDEVVNEVLGRLDTLDMNLTTTEDVPVLIQALSFSSQSLNEAIRCLDEHDSKINLEERKKKYSSDPLYAPFCKGNE